LPNFDKLEETPLHYPHSANQKNPNFSSLFDQNNQPSQVIRPIEYPQSANHKNAPS